MLTETALDLNRMNNLNISIPSSKQARSQTFANEILARGVSINLWRKLCMTI
jgi:hypothetical protein